MGVNRRKLVDVFLQSHDSSSVDVIKASEYLKKNSKRPSSRRHEITEEMKNTHYGIQDKDYGTY